MSPESTSETTPAGPESEADSQLRGRRRTAQDAAHWRHILGRAVLIWIVAYLVFRRDFDGALQAADLALVVTLGFLPFVQWAAHASRAMAFAFGTIVATGIGVFLGFASLSALAFWAPGLGIPLGSLVVIAIGAFVAVAAWDLYVDRSANVPLRVLIIGTERTLLQIATDSEREYGRDAPFRIVAVVGDTIDSGELGVSTQVSPLSRLEQVVIEVSPDLVVFALERGRPDMFRRLLAVAEHEFRVVGLPEFYEFVFGRLPIRELTSAWFMSMLHLYNRPYSLLAKRSFDIVVALMGLLLASFLIPFVAVIVKLTRGPLLYRQDRVGEHGRIFSILKFRSMAVEAEAAGEARWAQHDDPRLIPGGRLLRRSRLDEVPQLWNVLRGEMSIVGPRPERPEFLAVLEAEVPFWSQRNLLKPGITGWAQIRAGYASDALGAEEKLSYDLWYLRHRSLILDAMICFKTVGTLLTGKGSR